MTHDEYDTWKQGTPVAIREEIEVAPATTDEVMKTITPTVGEFDGPKRTHLSHSSPRTGVYQHGNFKISAERMKEFLDSFEKFGGVYEDVAADLGIQRGSVSAYKSVAVRHGLLAGKTREYRKRDSNAQYSIGDNRAKDVATMYQMLKGNTKRVARALGVTEGTARTYVNIAKKRGFINETS
jgi:hypothetical protein